MALINEAVYNEIVVTFDPIGFGILSIEAWNNTVDGDGDAVRTSQGLLDRVTVDGDGNKLPGVYNTGPYDPDMPDDVSGLDIDGCIRAVRVRRLSPSADPAVGAALVYNFDENSRDNEVDVTTLDLSGIHPYVSFMLIDPIHTAIRQREGQVLGGSAQPTAADNLCVIGTIRKREDDEK